MSRPPGAYIPAVKERRPSIHAERLRNSVADWSAALAAVSDMPSAVRQDVVDALALARRFNAEVVRPLAPLIDRRAAEEPGHVPRELIQTASDWGLFTLWMPSLFGGKGWNFLSLYAFLEEVSTACLGIANVVGVHYMGVAMLTASWNMRLACHVFKDVCDGERRGEPRLISLALNEPDAGSDVADTLLLARAKLGTLATPQADGGQVLDGRKTMIANGHVSAWHMVVAYEDLARPADTMVVLAVRADTPGLSLTRVEDKLGQRACVASELVFQQCAVPARHVAFDRRLTKGLARPHRELAQTLLDYVTSCTRAGVGAFAAGAARGAYEAARDNAMRKLTPSGRMVEQQWVQTQLAEMGKNAALARQAYLDSALANGMGGLFRLMFFRPLYWADQLAPLRLWRAASQWTLSSRMVTRFHQQRLLAMQPREWQSLVSGLASSAKVAASDLAMTNIAMAMDLMGPDGLRHEVGMEKRLRDARLLQIYEGTNQLNLVNLFKSRVRAGEGIAVFVRDDRADDADRGDGAEMPWPDDSLQAWWTTADRFARGHAALADAPAQEGKTSRAGAADRRDAGWRDSMHGLGWASLCADRARGGQGQPVGVLCRVLEALAATDAGAAATVYGSAAAHLALNLCALPAERQRLLRDVAIDWLAWPAFHGVDDQLWPAVDAQGYLRGHADMLVGGTHAPWAVLPAQMRDQGIGLVLVDLRHPAVIRGAELPTLGLHGGGLADIEFGGVPCELLSADAHTLFQALSGRLAPAVLAMLCGVARASMAEAMRHARGHHQGGGPLMGWPEVRRMLSLMQERLRVMQGLLASTLAAPQGDHAAMLNARYAVLHAGGLACEQTSDGVQVLASQAYGRLSAQAGRWRDAHQIKCLMGGVAGRRQALIDEV